MHLIVILFILLSIILLMLSITTIKIQAKIYQNIQIDFQLYLNGISLYKPKISLNFGQIINLFNNKSTGKIKKYKNILKKTVLRLLKKLHIERFSVSIDIGLIDAAKTCITAGFLKNIISCTLIYVNSNISKIDNFNVLIKPQFNTLSFGCTAYCIIKIRVGYIILESIRALNNIIFRR